MTALMLDISMSLGGFVAGPRPRAGAPLRGGAHKITRAHKPSALPAADESDLRNACLHGDT
jgi:hypothetical protein